eukprot:Sspe_Gene.32633::Locus_15979_Transcript_1_2_Confidence_0.800_Length_468::g.32633::m.32633
MPAGNGTYTGCERTTDYPGVGTTSYQSHAYVKEELGRCRGRSRCRRRTTPRASAGSTRSRRKGWTWRSTPVDGCRRGRTGRTRVRDDDGLPGGEDDVAPEPRVREAGAGEGAAAAGGGGDLA